MLMLCDGFEFHWQMNCCGQHYKFQIGLQHTYGFSEVPKIQSP